MAKVKNPVLFSKYFKLSKNKLSSAGLIDPFINVDTQLFIDPVLLEKSKNPIINTKGVTSFKTHFSNYIRLLIISKAINDAAWKGAKKLLNLKEPPENGLGYGGSSRSGSSRPEEIRSKIMKTSKEIVDLGSSDPEMISLMGFFEEKVGPDTISDFTTRVIVEELAEITEAFCISSKIPVYETRISKKYKLPEYTNSKGTKSSIVLIPLDIVRDLPMANDWSEIEEATYLSEEIRQKVNIYLGGIIKPTVADRKNALKQIALSSSKDLETLISVVKEYASPYNESIDALGYIKLKEILGQSLKDYETTKKYDFSKDPNVLKEFVIDTIKHFKHHVEKGNLWEELWNGNTPKKERAAQLIYFAISDCFCRANNIDISPEANMGGGPVDFKFSKGYKARVVVEMKRSSGTVRHGYEKQLEIYKDASRTNIGIFIVMDFGDIGQKVNQIKEIQSDRIKQGEIASDIIVIDSTKKLSASKRK